MTVDEVEARSRAGRLDANAVLAGAKAVDERALVSD